jgi:hypothetical protein
MEGFKVSDLFWNGYRNSYAIIIDIDKYNKYYVLNFNDKAVQRLSYSWIKESSKYSFPEKLKYNKKIIL